MGDVEFKYNYIISGAKGFYEVAYYDLFGLENVKYYSSALDSIGNPLIKRIARLNYSNKVNSIIQRPFDFLVKDKFFLHEFPNKNKPLCFILFFHSIEFLKVSYFREMKRKNPEIKFVVYFQDIISSRKSFNLDEVREFADELISYDKGDSMKYDMLYYPTPFSIYEVPENPSISYSDVYFVGLAKNRYKKILHIYEKCQEENLKCDFNILGVPKHEQVYSDQICYNQSMTYVENLKHVVKTKCILEIMQQGADGFTPRLWESIVYDKHLLTNNRSIIDTQYYDSKAIHFVDDGLQNLGNEISTMITNEEKLKISLSPINLIKFIETKI